MAEKYGVAGDLEFFKKRRFRPDHHLFRVLFTQSLTNLLTGIRFVGDYLHVEPQEVAHLIECRLERLKRLQLRKLTEGLEKFGIVRRLHSSKIQLTLNGPQVFRNPQNTNLH